MATPQGFCELRQRLMMDHRTPVVWPYNRLQFWPAAALQMQEIDMTRMAAVDSNWITTPDSTSSRGFSSDDSSESRTTLVMKNLPRSFDRNMLKKLLDSEGFAGSFDFLYVPLQWNQEQCVGYGLVNFVSVEAANRVWDHFVSYRDWDSPGHGLLELCWDTRHQGLQQLIKYYRNNSVMHPTLPDDCKPVLFNQGKQVPFPPPTKALTTPKSLRGSKFNKSWGDAKDKLVSGLAYYLKEAEAKPSQ